MPGINHVSVHAADLEASLAFYEDLLGATRIPTPVFDVPIQWLALGDGDTQLHLFERAAPAPEHHHFGIAVEDLEPVFRAAERRGAFDDTTTGSRLVLLPGDVVQLYLRDPAGNLVEVDAAGVDRLPADMREHLDRVWDKHEQTDVSLTARLPVSD